MTAPVHVLNLPDILREHTGEIERALTTPLLAGEWPEKTAFLDAPQPAAIGKVLVEAIGRHQDLAPVKIGYLFREKMTDLDKLVLARASTVGGKLQFYSGLTYLIEFNWSAWKRLRADQRVALVDHELCHFAREETKDGWKWSKRGHDLEEFREIIVRWGAWNLGVRAFAQTMATAQIDLFSMPLMEVGRSDPDQDSL